MEQTGEKKGGTRNSSYEILRILCILGILYMHMLGEYGSEMSHGTQVLRVISDSLFNAGVTCFILISGYFGINCNIKKLVSLDAMVIFYDVIGLVIYYLYGKELGLKTIVSAFLPIVSGKYWFLSCYFFLTLLAPYIDILLEHLEKKQMEKFVFLLIVLFYLIPTFLYFQLMQDNGKGLPNMIVVYIVGRYIGRYQQKRLHSKEKLLGLFLINLCLIIVLNLVTGKVQGSISTIWSRDCSIFILVSAILLFSVFSSMQFYNKAINRIAGSVLAVYVLSPYIQFIMEQYIAFEKFDGKPILPLVIGALVVVSAVACILVDQLRQMLLSIRFVSRRQ